MKKRNYEDRPILITGCARSGTSIVGGIVNYCGAFGGAMTGKTPHNRRGQFENNFIRNQIVKPHLRKYGYDPLGQKPLPDIEKLPIDMNWKTRVINVMKDQGYKSGPWFYKGAKMCLFWPQWHFAFPTARWIFVRRENRDIINSCLKTGFMSKYKKAEGWQKWIDVHMERLEEMKDAGMDVVEVWPSKIISGNYGEIKNAIHHVGLRWNRDVVHDFIDPRLWHGKAGKGDN